jgi:hypothetical protein
MSANQPSHFLARLLPADAIRVVAGMARDTVLVACLLGVLAIVHRGLRYVETSTEFIALFGSVHECIVLGTYVLLALKSVRRIPRAWAMSNAQSAGSDSRVARILDVRNALSLFSSVALGSAVWGAVAHYLNPPSWISLAAILAVVFIAILRVLRRSRSEIVESPKLLFLSCLRVVLTPDMDRRYLEPHVEDTYDEYFACLARNDPRGARWAVIRGTLYAIPSWLWALCSQIMARVIYKSRA